MIHQESFFRHTVSIVITTLLIAGCSGGGSGGGNAAPNASQNWLIPPGQVVDGGPGKDGIPSIDQPQFESATTIANVADADLVVVLRDGNNIKAYPHDIMTWHEVVNDGSASNPFTMSYCPLTDSAVAWKGNPSHNKTTFGVSGLLYNSNLILYDRQTNSNWSQMLQQAGQGTRAGERPTRIQVIEMSFAALKEAFPDALVLTRQTGFTRPYDDSPYGNYLENSSLLFPVSPNDNRLHPKERVIGIHSGDVSKVYQIDSFDAATQAINEQFLNQSIIVVGDSAKNFAAIYDRQLGDGTILTFSPVQGDFPNVLSDDEKNIWDIFGTATSGPRVGEQLRMTMSYTALWFSWAAFFPDPEIHFN